MNSIIQNLVTIAVGICFAQAAYVLGYILIKKILPEKLILNFSFLTGLSLLLGFGIMANSVLVLSFFGQLNNIVLWLLLLIIICFGRKKLIDFYQTANLIIKLMWSWTKFEKIIFIGIIFCFLFYLSSVFVPPYRTDAIAYHLPETITIAENGINFSLISQPGKFSINMPLMMEVFYSSLYVLGSFSLIHLMHYFIILSGILVIYGFIKYFFDRISALFAILGIFTLYELLVNSTNAYVDAATTVFEICGLLLMWLWIKYLRNEFLLLSGVFYGFAISVKYNAFYGVLVIGLLFIYHLLFRKKLKFKEIIIPVLCWAVPMLLVGGFWYFKNMVLLNNPVYPFYFGHRGYEEKEFIFITDNIKLFMVDRTFYNYILIPYIFFFSSYYFSVLTAFIAWPFLLLSRKRFSTDGLSFLSNISIFVLLYLAIWFFSATHQVKFLFEPMILLLIILAVQLNLLIIFLRKKINYKILFVFAVAMFLIVAYKVVTSKNNYFYKVKKADLYYNFGIYNDNDFYNEKSLGEIYRVSRYINNEYKNTMFLNVWGSTEFFLKNGNKLLHVRNLLSQESEINTSTVKNYLNNKQIKYAIIDSKEMYNSFNAPVRALNVGNESINDRSYAVHNIILNLGTKVFEDNGVILFRLFTGDSK